MGWGRGPFPMQIHRFYLVVKVVTLDAVKRGTILDIYIHVNIVYQPIQPNLHQLHHIMYVIFVIKNIKIEVDYGDI